MPSNICGMTGQIVRQGAISKKTGHIYQKSVILKHLSSFPYCPITNTQMSIDDLVFIQVNNQKISHPQQSTISVVNNLKSQLDTLVLESFYLSKNIKEVKEQLCHSTAANQAAEMVIKRLCKQKQEVQRELQKIQKQIQV